jgi:hypothetical protein
MNNLFGIRYGFTGTQHFRESNKLHVELVIQVLESLKNGQEFTTGACIGIDDFVHRMCRILYPQAWHRVIVPANRNKVIIPEPDWNVEIIYMSNGTSYRDRNERIVDFTDKLHSFPFKKLEKPFSGTWMTTNIARARNIEFGVHILP